MNDYLIDRETLGKFVDELFKHKALPVDNAEELNAQREAAIKALDEKIGVAIFSEFTEEQNKEFNQMLDRDEEVTAGDYEVFFNKIGLNVEDVVNSAMKEFAKDFLGGQNAE